MKKTVNCFNIFNLREKTIDDEEDEDFVELYQE